MRNKKQYTKESLIRREVRDDGENSFTYELLMKESNKLTSFGLPLYSIRVGFTDKNGIFTSSEIKEAFADAGKAILFFEKLIRNLATPIDVAYIMEDELMQ